MLVIRYNKPGRVKSADCAHHWYIGDSVELDENVSIIDVYADGDELDYIRKMFDNIPIHKTKTCQVWTGDIARFIACHLDTTWTKDS